MTENLEERFREACSDYLAAADQADRETARAETAAEGARLASEAADRARDHLLRVAGERDAAAQLGDYGPAGGPVGDGHDEQRREHYTQLRDRPAITWMTPQRGSQRWHDMVAANECPECGLPWTGKSPDCPHAVFDRHPR